MFEEAFGPIWYYELSYKLTKYSDLCALKYDSDVLNMCGKLDSLVYVYNVSVAYEDQQS